MTIRALTCPTCGAPLRPASGGSVVCAYCRDVLVDVPDPIRFRPVVVPTWGGRPEDADKPRVTVGKHRYVLLGRLARGDACDVFWARRDARLSELIVLKLLRAPGDADLLSREATTLRRLHASKTPGAEHFRALLPQIVGHGSARPAGMATAIRWRSGFHQTLGDVRAAHPQGVEPRAAVWMWRRILELLGWAHRAGTVHGAILPPHLLIHPRDRGVVVIGWSVASMGIEPLAAFSRAYEAFYPGRVWDRDPATPRTDIAMSARCIAWALGGEATGAVPDRVPTPLARLVSDSADEKGAPDDAWALAERLQRLACTHHRSSSGRATPEENDHGIRSL